MLRNVSALIGLLAGTAATAQTPAPAAPADLAVAFGAREQVRQISLSPDGTKIAIVAPQAGQAAALLIGDLVAGGAPRRILSSSGDPDRLTRCDWATAKRLVCRVYMVIKSTQTLTYTRLLAIDADGQNLKALSADSTPFQTGVAQSGGTLLDWGADDTSGNLLIARTFIPEATTGRRTAETREGYGVEVVDTVKVARRTVEPPRAEAVEYISDGHGTVRIAGHRSRSPSGYDSNIIRYFYRKADNRDWLPLGDLTVDGSGKGFNPYAVDRASNAVYGFERVDGYQALWKVALDGSLKREQVLARSDVDVDGLLTIGRHKRVVGASYATDRRVAVFFDPALERLQSSLAKALPGKPQVSFLDASSDESKLLLVAGGDTEPGRYYVYDKGTKRLEEVLLARPQLDGVALAKVQPMTYPAADGTAIPGYLTLPPGKTSARGLPAIVMPHGGPGARDEWGFDWLSQYFAARGFAVLQPNFRGSAGYGDAWFRKNGFQSWRTAIGDVNDAGRWFVAQGVDPAKLAVFGWSYGGYAALQSAVVDPALFRAIVAVAPVTDLDMLREESRNFTNFLLVDSFIGKGPHVAAGSPARHAERITAPVLMFHGDLDGNVGVRESRVMADKLRDAGKAVDYVEYKGLDHYLEDSEARRDMLSRSDAFLRKALSIAP